MRRLTRFALSALIVVVLIPVVGAGIVMASFIFLPLPASLPEPRRGIEAQITHLYDRNGGEIGTIRVFETKVPVKPKDIPKHLKDAVIAAEDRNFYSHGGIDFRGTIRALWADLRGRGFEQGGSTITQQYVKNAFTGKERSITRKLREAILASQLDRQYDKPEILFLYLENVYLGDGSYGVGAAAENYFHKPVSQLTLSESATLAGLIPAPSRYMPRANPKGAEAKRRIVLKAMLQTKRITRGQFNNAWGKQVWLATDGFPPGPATVIQPRVRTEARYPYFQDYVQRYLEAKYGTDRVIRGGLRVYTTIDPEMQLAADASVGATLAGAPPDLGMSLVAVEPTTGYVRALVGGRDFNTSKVNYALGRRGGGSGRQPGSAFKPFVLATAFDQGVQPTRRYSGASPLILGGEDFHNYGGSGYGTLDLRTATHKSVNTVYVQLLNDVGVETTMQTTSRMGLDIEKYRPGHHGLSVALGALEVSPLGMASAYGVFAARGLRAPTVPVVRVLDADGRVLEDHTGANLRRSVKRVLKEEVADNVTDVLQGVLQGGGTAGGKDIGRPAAGKTGTAQDNKDAWFAGYTPALSTAVWMGFPNKDPVTGQVKYLKGIKGVGAVTGGSFPAETWERFMEAALAKVPATNFNEPAPIVVPSDVVAVEERLGYEPGGRRYASDVGFGGPYTYDLPPPVASPPPAPTTTSTSTTSTSTTSTSTTSTTSTTVFPSQDDDGGVGGPSP